MKDQKTEKQQKTPKLKCKYWFNPMKAHKPFCWECEYVRRCHDEHLMFHARIPNFIIDNYMHKVKGAAWKVLCYCASRANNKRHSPNHGKCWPKYKDIAKITGLAERYIGDYLKELEQAGLISRHQQIIQNGDERKTVNTITILWMSKVKKIQDAK